MRIPTLAQRARRATELAVEEFARLIGVDPRVVEAWERGERSPPPIGERLLELLVARPEVGLTLARLAMPGDRVVAGAPRAPTSRRRTRR